MKKNNKRLNILLGITGGIAAYKACDLVRLFTKAGHNVKVILTKNGSRFITPLTLETLSSNPVYTDLFEKNSFSTEHITLSKWADVLLVAPASANIIGKFASGIADDLLSTIFLSYAGTVILAPAMHTEMYTHSIVAENISKLKSSGVNIIPAETGDLASGDKGQGRFPDSNIIKDFTIKSLTKKKDLSGKQVLITAGPTIEKIDPVRFISSPSSGKMGIALAKEAESRGAKVTLIHGPLKISPQLTNGKTIAVNNARQMNEAVLRNKNCDIFIGTAAVGDFTPQTYSSKKIKKTGDISISLKTNPDIIRNFSQKYGKNKIVVGFAAESHNIIKNAKKKRKEKNLDMIIANDITETSSGFGSDLNRVTLIDKKGHTQKLPLIDKREVAKIVFDKIIKIKK